MLWSRFKLDAAVNEPLYVQIADRLRSRIASGELGAGERLPSSRELQKLLNVSSITIENGLTLLVKEGVLCRRPRCGTFVAENPVIESAAPIDDPPYIYTVFYKMPSISHYWFLVLSELESRIQAAGYSLMLLRRNTDSDSLGNIARYRNCRGIILCGYNSEKLSREISRRKLPVVLIGALDSGEASNADLDQVMHNDEERAMISTRHLLDLGHRRIVCVTGPRGSQYSQSQKSGFRKAMELFGIRPDAGSYIDLEDLNYEQGVQAGYRLLCSSPRPTAVYVGSDPVARAILTVAEKLGIDAPRELSVVGCGGLELDFAARPRLTTTVSAPGECARIAVEKLLRQISGDPNYRKSVSIVRIRELSYGDSTMICRENFSQAQGV